jgi:hypothetical protein
MVSVILVFTKVAHCKSAKEIWDKLQNIYEGDSKVKEVKASNLQRSVRTTKNE